jgi:hypothetical protein
MTHRGRRPDTPPSHSDTRRLFPGAAGVAPELLRDAPRRLGLVGLVFAIGHVTYYLISLLQYRLHWVHYRPEREIAQWVGIVMGFAVYWISRRRSITPESLVWVGVMFELVGGMVLVYPEDLVVLAHLPDALIGVSWLAVWITLFPLVLPASTALIVTTGLVTACTSPAAMGLLHLQGHPWPPPDVQMFTFLPNFVAAGLASFPSIVLSRLRRAVSEARVMGSYQLEERLGAGGMGEVWRASHRLLARPAAIKLIRTERLAQITGDEADTLLQRFDLEAQVTASLTSPHTVALYDFGVTEDGTLYYVMELLHGLDLERLVERFGPVPAGRCVALLAQACESLEEAHARGLTHRDIKPANLHVGRMGRRWDAVKVLDFGLVLRDRVAGRAEARLTAADQVGGTPAFMAPEMILGNAVDGRADLYALGCVAYWLLTGTMVFEGRTSLDVMMRHLGAEPVPPSQRTKLPIPRELEALVLACLAKDPAARPANASVMRRELTAIPLAEPWTDDDAARWWQVHMPELATEALSAVIQ